MTVSSSAEFRRWSIYVPNEVTIGHTVSGSYFLDVSGSTKIGSNITNRHQFTGSINQTGSGATTHFMDKVGIGLRSPMNMALTISGSVVSYQGIASPEYATGFAGYGYAWVTQSTDQKWFLMTDHLTVRGTMNIYELLIHQIRATNGSIWVSNSGKILSASLAADSTWNLFFDTGSDYGHTFLNGDIIRAQRWDADNNNLYQSDLRVIFVQSAEVVTASLNAGTTEPTGGMEYVRMGNEFTAVSASRQGAIYLTSDDTEAPYIDVIDNITTHSVFNTAGTIKVRMGKLTGFSDTDYGTLSGYGMYATGNVWLKGGIIATFGKLGGWMISSTYISSSDQNAIIDSSVPKLAFGATANTMDINSGSTGVFISGSGEFRFGGISDDYLKLWNSTFEIKGTNVNIDTENFHLSSSGLEISSSDSSINLRNLIVISGSTIPIIKVTGGIISASHFYVDQYGNLTASNAYLSGIISASAGNIGGWTINAQNIQATSNGLMMSSSGVLSASNFYVDAQGHLTASSAKVFGILSASAGNIAGWTILSDKIGSPASKYLSLNSASSSLFIYHTLGDYFPVVKVGNFTLSSVGTGSVAISTNVLGNYDFISPATESWSSSFGLTETAGFLSGPTYWRHTCSEGQSGSMIFGPGHVSGAYGSGFYFTASLSQSVAVPGFAGGDFITAGCKLVKAVSFTNTSSLYTYNSVILSIYGVITDDGTEDILCSQSVEPPLVNKDVYSGGGGDELEIPKSMWGEYSLACDLAGTYDMYQFRLELRADDDVPGLPGAGTDPPTVDSVIPEIYIDDTYLQETYGIAEFSNDGVFIQRSPSKYIRSDADGFTIKGAELTADSAIISELSPGIVHATTFDERADFDSSVYFNSNIYANGLFQNTVGIGTQKSAIYRLTAVVSSNQPGGILLKSPTFSSAQGLVWAANAFVTASLSVWGAALNLGDGLTTTNAQCGVYVRREPGGSFRGAGIAVHSWEDAAGSVNRTILTSGSLAEFNNSVMIKGTKGMLAIGSFTYATRPSYYLHISASNTASTVARFDWADGNYVDFTGTGSDMMEVYTILDGARGDLAEVAGVRLNNDSTTAGSQVGFHLVTNSAYAGIVGRRIGSNQQALDFYTENTTRTTKMTITHDGKVGIGITNPGTLLEVRGSGSFSHVSSSKGFSVGTQGGFTAADITIDDGVSLHHFEFVGGILVNYYTE